MKTYRQIVMLFGTLLSAVLLAATPAAAHSLTGFVYCDQDASSTITAGDLPLGGITVTATPTGNSGQTGANVTTAGGLYLISLQSVIETYTVALTAGIPGGASIVSPAGGTHTVNIDNGANATATDVNFLLKDCSACIAGGCDDNNPCTDDLCTAGGCTHTPNSDHCNDGNACTTNDICSAGVCGGTVKTCAAADQCHIAGTCDQQTGQCSNPVKSDGSACNDNSACTTNDVCTAGTCGGTTKACSDGNLCTIDACDPATGCVFINTTKPCDDGNACTVSDTCSKGACVGQARVCGDNNGCTDDSCNPQIGCVFTNNKSSCSDGDACTGPDICSGGKCGSGPPLNCDDGNPCTDDACGPNGCIHTNNAAPCNDNSLCTKNDVCSNGVCGGNTISCDDQNPCTDDSCKADVGCKHAFNANPCDDHNACTSNEQCTNGACIGFPPAGNCNDGNACTTDSCDPATGCVNAPNTDPCNDKNPCTQTDICTNGACVGSNAVVCKAADGCHDVGVCDTSTGACTNPSKPDGASCADGNACTQTDTCQGGTCVGSNPKNCAVGDACHDPGICDPQTGACSNGTKPDGTVCSDGNACTQTDTCQGGLCTGGNPKTCAGSDQCHDPGTCDPQNGTCSTTTKPDGTACTDGNGCTQTDTCQGGTCTGGNPKTCVASDQCHDPGTCDPQNGTCSNPVKPNGTSCNDNIACTSSDQCGNGVCAGTPQPCDDQNPCTDDSCGPNGCIHTNNTAACNDGDPCTTNDQCTNGACAGSGLSCDDGNMCNGIESCDPQTGQCTAAAPSGPPFLFCSSARLNNRATINADVGVNAVGGSLKIARDGFAADGTTMTVHDLTLANNTSVDNVKANASSLARGAAIRGTKGVPVLPIMTPCCPIPAATCGGANVDIQKNENHAPLLPGTYGSLSVMNNATVTLMPGTYTFCDVRIAKSSTITTTGTVIINVTGDFRLGNLSQVGPKPGDPFPALNVNGLNFRLGAEAHLSAITKAPHAEGHFGRSAEVNGTMCLDSAVTDKNLTLDCPHP